MLVNKQRLTQKMNEQGLDAIVATTLENVHYLTGVYNVTLQMFPHGGQCNAIVTPDRPDEPHVVAPTIDMDQFTVDSIVQLSGTTSFGTFYREPAQAGIQLSEIEHALQQNANLDHAHASPLDALVDALNKMGLSDKKVGIDEIGFASLSKLQERLPHAKLVEASSVLSWTRRVKTKEEIRRLRDSAHVTQQAILATAAIAREGVTEIELQREFNRSIISQGAIPKFALIRINGNAVFGQAKLNRTVLHKGDLIWFDVGCVYEGYWSDIARNVSVGEPTPRVRQLYTAMLKGEEHAIETTRAGMTGAEIFDLTIKATQESGAPHYRRHHVGHGIGAEVYEQPILAPNNDTIIEEGSVINIETPYYEYGLGAVHVEDPFVVLADGNEVLTSLSREMIIVE